LTYLPHQSILLPKLDLVLRRLGSRELRLRRVSGGQGLILMELVEIYIKLVRS
jgi:hypothetical protein